MRSSGLGDSDGCPTPSNSLFGGPVDGPIRDATADAKSRLRLVPGGQVISKAHDGRNSQIRQERNTRFSGYRGMAECGYGNGVGKNATHSPGSGQMTSGDAVRAALDGLIPPRGVVQAAKVMEISGSTLRNILKGQKTVTDDLIRQIRRLPGFSERYDAITGRRSSDTDAVMIGERLLRAFPGHGGGMIVFALENLAGEVEAESVANTLNSLAKVLREHTPRPPASKKNARSG